MNQLRRARDLVASTFRPPSPEPAGPSVPRASVHLAPSIAVSEGQTASFEAGDREIAVANVAGTYYAFNDICTHRRCPLSDGELDGTTLTCICHGSRFDIATGAVLRGPAERPVEVYPVRVEGDQLWVEVPTAEPAPDGGG